MSVRCFDGLENTSTCISGNRKLSCDDQCGFCTKLGDMSEALFLCSSANIQCSAACCWQYLTTFVYLPLMAVTLRYTCVHYALWVLLPVTGLVAESQLGRYQAIVAVCSLRQQLF